MKPDEAPLGASTPTAMMLQSTGAKSTQTPSVTVETADKPVSLGIPGSHKTGLTSIAGVSVWASGAGSGTLVNPYRAKVTVPANVVRINRLNHIRVPIGSTVAMYYSQTAFMSGLEVSDISLVNGEANISIRVSSPDRVKHTYYTIQVVREGLEGRWKREVGNLRF